MSRDEIQELISRAATGAATEADGRTLLEICQASPEWIEELARHVTTERLLAMVAADPHGHITAQEVTLRLQQERISATGRPEFVPAVTRRIGFSRWLRHAAAAAAIAAVAGFALKYWNSAHTAPIVQAEEDPFSMDGPPSEPRESAPPVAVLKRMVNARWQDAANDFGTGALLPAGWLRLTSGTVEVEFLRGAQVLLTGPAELRLDGENAAYLKNGKASAHVPEPAHGFRLAAPGMQVVDLGTEFGLNVPATGGPEVHVFEGEVTLARDGSTGTPEKLNLGNARRLEDGAFHNIPSRPADFPNRQEVASQSMAEGRERLKAWQTEMNDLARDPATLLSYTFEDEPQWSRTVGNKAAAAAADSAGTLVGAGWTGGRWPGKHAVEFRSQGDRLRFSIPGNHEALTCMVWLRVDSLPNPYNALLMPTHYEPGSFHWTLERGGDLRVAMLNEPRIAASQKNVLGPRAWDGPVSAPALSGMDFGRWIFLATTIDAATGLCTHYRDGEAVGSGKLAHKLPPHLGDVEFGNWGARRGNPEYPWIEWQPRSWDTRNFVGRLDELVILSRVLSQVEISRHFQSGMP